MSAAPRLIAGTWRGWSPVHLRRLLVEYEKTIATLYDQRDGYRDECAALVAHRAVMEQERDRLREVVRTLKPWDCPDCGPMIRIDEDGCCATCGRDAVLGGDGE